MGLSYMASGASLIASAGAQLVTFAILARTLGVDQFALFVALSAITTVVLPLCGLGAMEGLVRRTAQDRHMYAPMLGHTLIVGGITGTVLLVAGLLALPELYRLSDDVATNLVLTGLFLLTNIVLLNLVVLAEQIFLAHSRFSAANGVVVGFAIARTIAAALACLVVGIGSLAEWVVWQFAVHVLVVGACFIAVRHLGRPRFRVLKGELRLGAIFSFPIVLRTLRQNVDLLVLGLVATPEALGSYGVARRVLDSGYLAIGALHRLMYTGSAAAAVVGLRATMPRVYRVLIAATAIGLFASTSLYLLSPVLPLLFGHEFVSLVGFVQVLCWLLIVMAVGSVSLEALGSSGRHGIRAALLSISSILGALLVGVAAYTDGVEGVLIAAYVAEIGLLVASWIVLLRLVRGPRAPALNRQAMA